MSKRKSYKQVKRRVRKQENRQKDENAPDRDITLGRAARRGYGIGKAK